MGPDRPQQAGQVGAGHTVSTHSQVTLGGERVTPTPGGPPCPCCRVQDRRQRSRVSLETLQAGKAPCGNS